MNSKNQNPIGRLPSAGLRHRFAAGLPAAWLAVLVLGMLGCTSWAATLQVPGEYATIQAAINAADPGDEILVAAGHYTPQGSIVIRKSITIKGAGSDQTTLDLEHRGTAYGIDVVASDVHLEGFTIIPPRVKGQDGNTITGGSYALHAQFDSGTEPYQPHQNLTLKDLVVEEGYRTAFDVHGIDGVVLDGLVARGMLWGNGITLTACTDVEITDCELSDNEWGGIAFYTSSYLNRATSSVSLDLAKNNIVGTVYSEDNGNLIHGILAGIEGYNYTVTNGAYRFYHAGDLQSAHDLALAVDQGNRKAVIQDTTSKSIVLPGLSIQAAIDTAEDGALIEVRPGEYTESANYHAQTNTNSSNNPLGLLLNRSVTLYGAKADGSPILSADDVQAEVISSIQSNWGTNFLVTAPNVTIRGLKLTANRSSHQAYVNKSLEIIEDNFTLEACVVDANPEVGTIHGAVYFNDWDASSSDPDFVSRIKSYTIKNNILRGSISVNSGTSFGIAPEQINTQIVGNRFENSAGSEVKNAGISVTGYDDEIAWLNAPAVFPKTITGNHFADDVGGLLLARDDDPQYLPSLAQIQSFVQNNELPKWAYVTDGNELRYDERDSYPLDPEAFPGTTLAVQVSLSIQASVDRAEAGNTVHVGNGTYVENIESTVPVHIKGAESDVVIQSGSGVFVKLADGTADNASTLENVKILGTGTNTVGVEIGSNALLKDVVVQGHASGVHLRGGSDVRIEGGHISSNTLGIEVARDADLRHVEVINVEITNNYIGWYSEATLDEKPVLEDLKLLNVQFLNNKTKGFYTERLDNALLEDLLVSGNGLGDTETPGTGVELNLKWRDYSDITIRNSLFDGNGKANNPIFHAKQGALAIKARNDGGYASNPASLSDLKVYNNVFTDNGINISLGEPQQNNAPIEGLEIRENKILDAEISQFLNETSGVIDVGYNYWGPGGPTTAVISGPVVDKMYYTSYDDSEWPSSTGLSGLFGPIHIADTELYFETIQAAITAAQAGDVIELSAGEYQESPILVGKAVTIQGPNAGRKGSANDRAEEARIVNTKITITGNGAVLDGVEIYQTNDTAEAILVQAAATVKNSIIRRDGVNTGVIARGIVTASSTAGYSIVDNLFTGDESGGLFGGHKTWQSGIYLNGGIGSVTGNTFEKCRSAINADDFSSASITISGNTFRLCGTYLSFGGTSPTEGSHIIAGNDFGFDFDLGPGANPTLFNTSNVAANFRLNVIDNTFGGLPTNQLTDAQKFAIEARNFHRGRSGRNGVVDFVANQQVVVPGTTIAGAISAAAAGDSVLISPHKYQEDLSVSKKLTILGAKHGVAAGVGVVLGDDRPTAEETVIDGGFLITASEVSIDGLTIRNGRSLAGSWAGIGIRNGADDVTVTNVIIESVLPSGSSGIETEGTSDRLTVTDSTIRNNWRGVYLNPGDGHSFLRNVFQENNGSGVGIGSDGQSSLTVTDNVFSGHSVEAFGGSAIGSNVVFRENLFLAEDEAKTVAHYGGEPIDAKLNYWGAQNPDFAEIIQGEVNVDHSPWYADSAKTILVTSDNFTNQTIEEGETETYENLLISGGSTWTVEGGNLLVEEQFILDPGSTLNVIEGTVTFPDGSSFGGTFTFFNSFGSIHINGDLDIIASASGLILVSDVHVADGATITVNGNFTIDGSSVDSDGRFTLVVESGAQFTMARTVFSDGDIQVKSGSTEIYDNFISDAKIQAFAGASGARYFHNVVADSVTTQDLGTHGVITEVDGWANVGTAANTQNNLPLGVELPLALLDAKRTMKDGVAYIQSGDEFFTTISVNKLQTEISGAEVLLGYNTQYFSAGSIGLETGWGNGGAPITQQDASLVIGRYNASLQLGFDPDNPMGTKADQTIADLGITAKPNVEGTTQVFYRVKAIEDDLITGTRLTAGGPNPTFLTPFTTNTGAIVIDNTAPEIDTDLTGVSFTQDGHDLKQTVTLQGTIQFEGFKAFDALAGIDDEDAVLTLVGPGGTYTASQVSAVTANPADPTVYGFTFPVTSATENGQYQVVFTVTDRSGNEASHSFGTIEINKNQLAVTVELEGAAAGPFSREVTFVFSAANGAVLETRNETLTFTNGVGSFTFPDVDGNTAYLSAKPQHHLRKRLEVSFDADGQGSVAFTGADLLHGGDLNDDNVVNMLDYAILRFYWLNEVSSVPDAVAADIDGDGSVNQTDYNILQARFYQQGIAQP